MVYVAQDDLQLPALRKACEAGRTPSDVLAEVMARIATYKRRGVWIHVLSEAQIKPQLAALDAARRAGKSLPLYGVPFAVKDNIDVAGIPTTAACPAFAYTPAVSATCVQRLCDAGAIVVGKTNLDQFATGLVGTRSPYGTCENAFDPRYISGGSSSGSAVAVAGGLVSFALATDTAGSGRVPAAFNNLIGLKPTKGLIPTDGVVPACRSLDCVAIFASTCDDAEAVLNVAAARETGDVYARLLHAAGKASFDEPVCGIPRELEFFGNRDAEALFKTACTRLEALNCTLLPIDFRPFRRAGDLLYDGPWVAERLVAAGQLLKENPDALRPELRTILQGALRYTATDAFEAMHRLAQIAEEARHVRRDTHFLMLPTAGTIYRIDEVNANPLELNRNLGTYTTFVNLLDQAAIAVPAGFLPGGLPWGVTFIGPRNSEPQLLSIARKFHAAVLTEGSP